MSTLSGDTGVRELMDHRDHGRAFTHARRDPLNRVGADVADREYARLSGRVGGRVNNSV